MDTRLLCLWDFPGKNTGVGCPSILQRIFPTQGLNLGFLCVLHWQVVRSVQTNTNWILLLVMHWASSSTFQNICLPYSNLLILHISYFMYSLVKGNICSQIYHIRHFANTFHTTHPVNHPTRDFFLTVSLIFYFTPGSTLYFIILAATKMDITYPELLRSCPLLPSAFSS